MAQYDPPQPLWKRNLAGILDFVLAFTVFAILAAQVFPATGLPTFIARNPNIHALSLNAFVATIGLTVGYFIILGGTGGTVFQRLFAMRRIVPGADIRVVMKTIVRSDEKRRVRIYQRDDGLYSFIEERRVRGSDGEPCWRPYPSFAALCPSADAAESQARAAIGWVGLMP